MNLTTLTKILDDTTTVFRKGDVVTTKQVGTINVTTVDAFPAAPEAEAGLKQYDLHFVTVGVDPNLADDTKTAFIEQLNEWPDAAELVGGPSYIAVGATIGDQTRAFQFFALGAYYELWSIVTPEALGVTGDDADAMAGNGFIMCTGYHRNGLDDDMAVDGCNFSQDDRINGDV